MLLPQPLRFFPLQQKVYRSAYSCAHLQTIHFCVHWPALMICLNYCRFSQPPDSVVKINFCYIDCTTIFERLCQIKLEQYGRIRTFQEMTYYNIEFRVNVNQLSLFINNRECGNPSIYKFMQCFYDWRGRMGKFYVVVRSNIQITY